LAEYEIDVATDTDLPEKLEGAFQGQSVVDGGSIRRAADLKAQTAIGTEAGLIYKSFEWISSWGSLAAGAHHGGRATLAYLQSHPDDEAVHVVMG
jgi:hypothetical protein